MSKQTINIILIIVVSFVLGYSVSFIGDNTFQAGWDAAEERLAEFGLVLEENMEISTVNGLVQEITDNKITLEIEALEILADSSLNTRVIEITDNTIFYRLVEKDSEVFEKEMEEFDKKTQEGLEMVDFDFPEPFIKEEITAEYLQGKIEPFIDDTFAWLAAETNETPTLNFTDLGKKLEGSSAAFLLSDDADEVLSTPIKIQPSYTQELKSSFQFLKMAPILFFVVSLLVLLIVFLMARGWKSKLRKRGASIIFDIYFSRL